MTPSKTKQATREMNAIGLIIITLILSFLSGSIVGSSWNNETFTAGNIFTVLSGALLSLGTLIFSAIVAKRWNASLKILTIIFLSVIGGTGTGFFLVEIPAELVGLVIAGSYFLAITAAGAYYYIEYIHRVTGSTAFYR